MICAIFGLFYETMTYKPFFHACSTILDSSFLDRFVIVSFFLRNISFRCLTVTNKLSLFLFTPMFLSRYCYFGCDETVYLQLYPYPTFLIPAVAHILAHSVNLAFGPKSSFKMRPVYNFVAVFIERVETRSWLVFVLCAVDKELFCEVETLTCVLSLHK